MKTIYKYDLNIGATKLDLPKDAKILRVDVQRDILVMWVELDPSQPSVTRIFLVYGTGHPLVDEPEYDRVHVGTTQLHDGAFVAHVYEIIPRTNLGAQSGRFSTIAPSTSNRPKETERGEG